MNNTIPNLNVQLRCFAWVFLLQLLFGMGLYAQVAGNKTFNRSEKSNAVELKKNLLYLSDSTFLIEARVLKNVPADHYVAVFALSQEAKTIVEANQKINERIQAFTTNIQKLNVPKEQVFVDVIGQYRIYDWAKNGTLVEETLQGFELTRNVCVRYDSYDLLDQLLPLAAKSQIFDLVKVEYVVDQVDKVYNDLFEEVSKVIEAKKKQYVQLTKARIKPESQPYGESFTSHYPDEQYQSYQANTSSDYQTSWYENNRNDKKTARKVSTFYYEGLSVSGFDRVLNPNYVAPQPQFVLLLQVKFKLEK